MDYPGTIGVRQAFVSRDELQAKCDALEAEVKRLTDELEQLKSFAGVVSPTLDLTDHAEAKGPRL